MTDHLDLRYCIRGTARTTDSALLDQIEQALPEPQDVALGGEYQSTRSTQAPDQDTDATGEIHILQARMTFTKDGTDLTERDGDPNTPEDAARDLFTRLKQQANTTDLDAWELVLYRTPEGMVDRESVRAYYEANPEAQPTDANGESFVPHQFDPDRHELDRASVDQNI